MASRDQLIKKFVNKQKGPQGDPFGSIGNLTPAQRIQRGRDGSKIMEDDPRFPTRNTMKRTVKHR